MVVPRERQPFALRQIGDDHPLEPPSDQGAALLGSPALSLASGGDVSGLVADDLEVALGVERRRLDRVGGAVGRREVGERVDRAVEPERGELVDPFRRGAEGESSHEVGHITPGPFGGHGAIFRHAVGSSM